MLATRESIADEEQVTESATAAEIGLFQDIPSWIWTIFLGAWAMFFGLMVLFFATSSEAAFVVTIVVLFGLMAFGLPLALGAQSKCGTHDCKGVVHTLTGPLSARAAGAQIALIPVAVVIGLAGFILLAM